MKYDEINELIDTNTTVKLIRAESAPLILGFIYKTFKEELRLTRSESELLNILDDYIREVNEKNNLYNRSAKDYLTAWADAGFLRRFYDMDDEPLFELTAATENTFRWIEELNRPEFVGTESRLKLLFDKLKEIASKSKKDIPGRLQELEEEKRQIDLEIEKAKAGKIDVWDNRKIKEEYMIAREAARRLLSDFRQVEHNFREIDRNFRKQIITTNQVKGEVLGDLFKQHDFLWQTDQGKSFLAFWEFLLSQPMQAEFDQILNDVIAIPSMDTLENDGLDIGSIRNRLIEAGDKTNKTTGSLLEQLRKYLEHKAFFENKKIHDNILDILKIISEDENSENGFLILEEAIKIDLTLERPLFAPPHVIKFSKTDPEEGKTSSSNSLLFEQFDISLSDLRNNIKTALKNKSKVSFPELLETYEINKGVAEVIGYVEIASKSKVHICNDELPEEIFAFNSKSEKKYKVKVPQIIFCK